MNTVRGLTVWLGAPILASLICTAGWQMLSGGSLSDWRPIVGIGAMALMFTLGGSTLLSLAFASMRGGPVTLRYFALVALGAASGGLWMLMLGASSMIAVGAVYGVVTATLWAGLHRTLFGSR